MKFVSQPIVRGAASVVAVGVIALTAFVGVTLVSGGNGDPSPGAAGIFEDEPTAPPGLDPQAPPPRTVDPNETPLREGTPGPTPFVPASVIVLGIAIPIPEGSTYYYGAQSGTRVLHWVWKGESSVWFEDNGETSADVKPTDEEAFGSTLDAFWTLTQMTWTPSPSFVTVKGENVPLPEGSFYRTLDKPVDPNDPLIYTVRLSRSAIVFDASGIVNDLVKAADVANFQTTYSVLASFSQTD